MIEGIREKFDQGLYEYSEHAVNQSIMRLISDEEIQQAIQDGVVIEDYPDDKYGSSCLVYGKTRGGRPMHIQCSYPSRPLAKIVTVYEPDPGLWIDFQKRRES